MEKNYNNRGDVRFIDVATGVNYIGIYWWMYIHTYTYVYSLTLADVWRTEVNTRCSRLLACPGLNFKRAKKVDHSLRCKIIELENRSLLFCVYCDS